MAEVPLEGEMSIDVGMAGAGNLAERVALAKKYAGEAIRLADTVCELERKYLSEELTFADVHRGHMMGSIQTIFMAVASVEAGINEVLADVRTGNPLYRPGVTPEMCVKLDEGKRVERVAVERQAKIITRAQTICERLKGGCMDSEITKSMAALIDLRNALTHSSTTNEPYVDEDTPPDKDSYEDRFGSLFPHSGLARADQPFFTARCLGAGCVRWAVETAYAFSLEFERVTGFSLGFMKPVFPDDGAPKK